MPKIQNLTILGATGTIGMNTLDVVGRHPDRFHVVALTAHRQTERLLQQCRQFQPEYAVMLDADCAAELQHSIAREGLGVKVLSGLAALEEVASLPQVDSVMAAIVG